MNIADLKDYTVVSQGAENAAPVATAAPKQGGLMGAAQGVSNFIGAKGLTDLAGSQIAKFGLAASGNMDAANRVEQPSFKNVVGSAIQTGANFLPGAGIGAGLAKKALVGAGTGYAMDVGSKLQQNKPVADAVVPGVGTAVGTALPVGGAVARPGMAIIGRLFKGLGSGLSGVSADTIQRIVDNPEFAQQASEKLAKTGNNRVLENNARTIVNGVSKVRQEARGAYGKGLESLQATDINPTTFKESVKPLLDKYGVSSAKGFGNSSKSGTRTLANVEFSEPKNIAKASELIDKLQNAKLDGKSLRKLADDIESSKYKIATSDERLSFNSFINDLSSSVKSAVNSSTDKLKEIDANFSNDMQLTEAVQNIFGKVNYKNLPEVVKASQKLEALFSQKGLAPEVTDNFLKRIGVNPAQFKTTEAVRQIDQKSSGANSTGLSIGEVVREATSAVVTPEMVKNIATATGLAKEKFVPLLESLKTPARNAVIQALLQAQQGNQQ